MHQPRFDGVEVNEPHRLATGFVDHHVVDLGVAVDGSLLQLAALQRSFQHIHPITPCLDELLELN